MNTLSASVGGFMYVSLCHISRAKSGFPLGPATTPSKGLMGQPSVSRRSHTSTGMPPRPLTKPRRSATSSLHCVVVQGLSAFSQQLPVWPLPSRTTRSAGASQLNPRHVGVWPFTLSVPSKESHKASHSAIVLLFNCPPPPTTPVTVLSV